MAIGPELPCQLRFHLLRQRVWKRVEMLVALGEQAAAVPLHDPRRVFPAQVCAESLFGRQSGHPDIETQLSRQPVQVRLEEFLLSLEHVRPQFDDVEVAVGARPVGCSGKLQDVVMWILCMLQLGRAVVKDPLATTQEEDGELAVLPK